MIARNPTDLIALSPSSTVPLHVVRDIVELAAASHAALLSGEPNCVRLSDHFAELAAKHAHAALGMSESTVPAPTSQELYYRARLERMESEAAPC